MGTKHRKLFPSQIQIGHRVPMGPTDYWMVTSLPEKQADGQFLIRFDNNPDGALAPAKMRILVKNEDTTAPEK